MNYLVEGVIGIDVVTALAACRHAMELPQRRRGRDAGAAPRLRREAGRPPSRSSFRSRALVAALIAVRRLRRAASAVDPLEVYALHVPGRVRHAGSRGRTRCARRAADAHRAVHRAAGAARPDDHRRRRRAACSAALAAAAAALSLPTARRRWWCSSRWRSPAWSPAALWIALGRRAAPLPRRQRDDLEPAAHLHRASRCSTIWSKGRCAIRRASTSRRPTPIGDANMIGNIPGIDVHWGLVFGIVVCVACLCADLPHHVRLRRAHRRRQRARGAARGPAGRARWCCVTCLLAAPPPAWPAWSRSPRCTAAPTPRSRPATATPASWSPSSPGRIRSRSSRWRSCSAASARAAACCSAGSACPTPRCWCCRASSSWSILASETLYGRFRIFQPKED